MSNEENNSVEALYEMFRDSVLHGRDDNFSEENLIDIFDFAGDNNDDFIRLEVLLKGAAKYPDSDFLNKRKAIFLSGLSNDALRTYFNGNEAYLNDRMWAILRCRAAQPSGKEAEKALREILEMDTDFSEDEEVIQFVSLVRFLQMEDWLIDNLDDVKARAGEMSPTLLFEIARLAESRHQIETGIRLLEQLTMDEPFNLDFWALLAELQSNIEKFDDALTSLDYAKAISPDDGELIALEGYIHLKRNDPEKALSALRQALKIVPDNYPARRNLLEALKLTGNHEEFKLQLKELFADEPSDEMLMMAMLAEYPKRIPDTMAKFYAYNDPDEQTSIKYAGDLCGNGFPESALKFLQWYDENYQLSQGGKFTILELLYLNGKYAVAYDYISNSLKDPVLQPNELPVLGIVASTMLRLGMFRETKQFCDYWIEKLSEQTETPSSMRLIDRGLLSTLNSMAMLLSVNPALTEDQISRVVI